MKLKDMKYREIEKHFFKVSKAEDVLKRLNVTDIIEPFYGLFYTDYEFGLTLVVIGNDSNYKKYLKEIRLIARYDSLLNCEFQAIENETCPHYLEFFDTLSVYYKNNGINAVRNNKRLDSLRKNEYPDDFEVLVVFENGKMEKLWGKSFDYMEKDDIYIFRLLNDSYYDKDFKAGRLVAAKLDEKNNVLIFIGFVELKN